MKLLANNALEKIDLCLSRHLLFFAVSTLGSNASAAPGSRVSTRSKSTSQRGVRLAKIIGELMHFRMSFLILFAFQISVGMDFKAGYNLHENLSGPSHLILGEAVLKYFEFGLKVGYGTKPIFERERKTGSQITIREYDADVFRLNIPLKLKYNKWPYLISQIGYERMLGVDLILENPNNSGYDKKNEISIYYGGGYEFIFRKFGVYLDIFTRSILTESNKTKFFNASSPISGSTYEYNSDRFSPIGPDIYWETGLNYYFEIPFLK